MNYRGALEIIKECGTNIDGGTLERECVLKIEEAVSKTEKLEEDEKKFGVDLLKLLSAKTIFVDEGGGVLVAYDFKISFVERCVYVSVYDCDDTELPFSDYGKTWALTEEEMEK